MAFCANAKARLAVVVAPCLVGTRDTRNGGEAIHRHPTAYLLRETSHKPRMVSIRIAPLRYATSLISNGLAARIVGDRLANTWRGLYGHKRHFTRPVLWRPHQSSHHQKSHGGRGQTASGPHSAHQPTAAPSKCGRIAPGCSPSSTRRPSSCRRTGASAGKTLSGNLWHSIPTMPQ